MKKTVTEMKNILEDFDSRLGDTEECIHACEREDRSSGKSLLLSGITENSEKKPETV